MASIEKLTDFQLLKLAWQNAAGWRGICHGVGFWITAVAWLLTAPFWLFQPWWDQVLSVLPTILGFTLSGFAIFLSFGSDGFKQFLAGGRDPERTPYVSVGSAFLMFVAVQLVALLFAMVVKAFHFPTPNFLMPWAKWIYAGNYIAGGLGYFLFIYGLVLVLRAALRIFRLSRWYNLYLRLPANRRDT